MTFEEFGHKDKYGNTVEVSGSGALTLYLSAESRSRDIGKLIRKNEKLHYLKRAKEKNRFRQTDAWGFHWSVVDKLNDEAYIGVRSELGIYRIKVGDAKKHGKEFNFKEQGFELQKFVPVEKFVFEGE